MPLALVVDDLTVKRDERTILSGLSMSAAQGEALMVTGPNGAGKTTLLRTIAGLLTPAGGRITLTGQTGSIGSGIGEQCHFVGHLNGIKPGLSVAENADFWAAYLDGHQSATGPALEAFRLSQLASVRAGYLSAGQKRRLGLTRLLLAPRTVWLLDEPAVSLDTASQALLVDVANRHLAGGGILVSATHQPLDIERAREFRLTGRGSSEDESSSLHTAFDD